MKRFFAAMGSLWYSGLAIAAFLLDLWTKRWAVSQLQHQGALDVWPGVFRFTYVENTGAAFGLFRGNPAILAVVTGIVLLGLFVMLIVKRKSLDGFLSASLWLFLGGALGNLFDRVVRGFVVDFIEVQFIRFPVFNVADICVCVAFALVVGWVLFAKEGGRHAGRAA